MKTKICKICKKEKSTTEFHKGNDKDGLRFECKECRIKNSKQYYEINREKLLKKIAKYRQAHKKEYKEYLTIYRISHKEQIRKTANKYYLKHKTEIDKYKQTYQQKHRKILLEKTKKRRIERRKIDINFKILCNLRKRIWDALKFNYKSKHTLELLGCSIDLLRLHLQSKFQPGMSFNNYGKGGWEVDHIIPCASFDLSKPEEQRKCFHYTNLQPLWAEDNLRKSDKYE